MAHGILDDSPSLQREGSADNSGQAGGRIQCRNAHQLLDHSSLEEEHEEEGKHRSRASVRIVARDPLTSECVTLARQSRPDSGIGVQVEVLGLVWSFPLLLLYYSRA